MFDTTEVIPTVPAGDDWFDPAWAELGVQVGQIPASQCVGSGWLALELDQVTADPAGLSDADLIDTIVGFERVSSWATARQAAVLAEFAKRRRTDDAHLPGDTPARYGGFAADEIGLALRCSRECGEQPAGTGADAHVGSARDLRRLGTW